MAGYQKKRFPGLQGQIFDCCICLQVVRDPHQCSGCGNLFCNYCIETWVSKNKQIYSDCRSCKFSCPPQSIRRLQAKALIRLYNDLDIKCLKCDKTLKFERLAQHQSTCGKNKCSFFDHCDSLEDDSIKATKPVCSQKCKILLEIIATNNDRNKIYHILKNFAPKSNNIKVSFSSKLDLQWKRDDYGNTVQFKQNDKNIFLKEEAFLFRSVITTEGFVGGCHYWEIHADSRTQNQLKIGLTASKLFDINTAFCDHNFGFAYYGLAQLRNGNNASGAQYGKKFKKSGVLGVYLNMNKGTLSFSLNGEDMGVAFTNNLLKKGPLYPAVALLHCSGCKISGQLSIPPIYKDK